MAKKKLNDAALDKVNGGAALDQLTQKTDLLEQKNDQMFQKADLLEQKTDMLNQKVDALQQKTDLLTQKLTVQDKGKLSFFARLFGRKETL